MRTLLEAGALVQRTFDREGWKFCFIGGIANFRWGTPRLTNDLDVTLLTGFGPEADFIAAVLREYQPRIASAAEFALDNRVVLLRTPDGFGLDIALGAMPFEERSIGRASEEALAPGISLRTCSAEDLIVHKAFAARPQDWVDVEGVILKQRGVLVWPQIWTELEVLADLKGEPELVEALRQVVARTQRVIGPFESSA